MTDSVRISLIGAIATVATTAINGLFAIFSWRRQKENGAHIKQFRQVLMPFISTLPKPVDSPTRKPVFDEEPPS
jgi:hypothetical protein